MTILSTGTLDSAVNQLRCNPQIAHAAEWEDSQVEDLVLRSAVRVEYTASNLTKELFLEH